MLIITVVTAGITSIYTDKTAALLSVRKEETCLFNLEVTFFLIQ